MKTPAAILLALLVAELSISSTHAAPPRGQHAMSAGLHFHSEHAAFEELPFGDDDLSYSLAYEYHEASAFWQFGVEYTPEVAGETNLVVKSVITPQISLMFKDRGWIGGVGLLRSHIETEEDSEWTDFYWQFKLGYTIPLGGLELDLTGIYVFEGWQELDGFEVGDLEYGGRLRFKF